MRAWGSHVHAAAAAAQLPRAQAACMLQAFHGHMKRMQRRYDVHTELSLSARETHVTPKRSKYQRDETLARRRT